VTAMNTIALGFALLIGFTIFCAGFEIIKELSE